MHRALTKLIEFLKFKAIPPGLRLRSATAESTTLKHSQKNSVCRLSYIPVNLYDQVKIFTQEWKKSLKNLLLYLNKT
jgi:hypothetical protein